MKFKMLITLVFMVCFVSVAYADMNMTENQETINLNKTQSNDKLSDEGKKDFAGLKFGVGISLTHDIGSNERIKSVEVVNGIIRVKEEENDIARVMLESHYFFTPNKDFLVPAGKWGIGPFIALQPGTDEIIEAIGFGIMIGFKRLEAYSTASSMNLGVGFVIDPSVTVLGDGLKLNNPLPEGENTARLKETSQIGILLLASFTF